MRLRFIALLIAWVVPAISLSAELTISIPLQGGRLSILQLRQALESELPLLDGIPDVDLKVDLRGVNGWVLTRALNGALGDGFQVAINNDALEIAVDPANLPKNWSESCAALDKFTRIEAPEATARQARRFGLHLPLTVDSKIPLVVLIHGLDGDGASCADLAELVRGRGFQTATFVYPTERPLDENVELLTQHMLALHERFPDLRIDLITESMGGLIARRYVEGPGYAGGVDHFILIAPPNEGTTWIRAGGWPLKLIVNAANWKNDPQWSPAWMITEGLCQEACDLRPDSQFLQALNSNPRRAGVRYTIIAGDRPARYRYEARLLAIASEIVAEPISNLWGFRQAEGAIQSEREQLLNRTGDNDGPVSLSSARLAGASDFVTIPADHAALFESVEGRPPAAWPVIQNRLAQ